MTLRELAAMAEARVEAEWDHTAALLAFLANLVGPRATPADFHPVHLRRAAASRPRMSREEFKGLLVAVAKQAKGPKSSAPPAPPAGGKEIGDGQ